MNPSNHTSENWAILLAAGEGTRLAELTGQGGRPTPKQYCSLRGGRSLLGDTLARATRLVPRERQLVIVAEHHRPLWRDELAHHPPENVIVQPRNRGTSAGILLPLLALLERDPGARVLLLPSDHHVADEGVLASALRRALRTLEEAEAPVTLLGIGPDAPETGYGWILPAGTGGSIERFVEKPDAAEAARLQARGALWNSFLLAARGTTLLRLYRRRLPRLMAELGAAFGRPEARERRLAALYESLEPGDFSRQILQGSEPELRLEVVPPCGWTDLGTPERVAACLAALPERDPRPERRAGAPFDLSRALGALRGAAGRRVPVAAL